MPSSASAGPPAPAQKVRENRLRAAARRQGLVLVKSRARDPHSLVFNTYMLVRAGQDEPVYENNQAGMHYGRTLNEIERFLTGGDA